MVHAADSVRFFFFFAWHRVRFFVCIAPGSRSLGSVQADAAARVWLRGMVEGTVGGRRAECCFTRVSLLGWQQSRIDMRGRCISKTSTPPRSEYYGQVIPALLYLLSTVALLLLSQTRYFQHARTVFF